MKRPPVHPARSRRGFSLIELIAVMAVLSALGTVVSLLLFSTFDGFLGASNRAQLQSEASTALDRVVRELRSMPLDAGASSLAPDISSMDVESLAWDDESLALVGDELRLAVDGGAATTLLRDVSSFALSAFDESNAPLTLPLDDAEADDVRRVEINLTMTRSATSVSLRTRVFLRCTMSGAGS